MYIRIHKIASDADTYLEDYTLMLVKFLIVLNMHDCLRPV